MSFFNFVKKGINKEYINSWALAEMELGKLKESQIKYLAELLFSIEFQEVPNYQTFCPRLMYFLKEETKSDFKEFMRGSDLYSEYFKS